MKLITKEIREKFRKQGDTSEKNTDEIDVICKFFNPAGAGTWYAYEYDPEYNELMCFVNLGDPICAELGSVSVDELEELRLPLGLKIERDLHFKPQKLSAIMEAVKGGAHV